MSFSKMTAKRSIGKLVEPQNRPLAARKSFLPLDRYRRTLVTPTRPSTLTEYDTSLPRKSHSSCTNRCEKGAGGHGEIAWPNWTDGQAYGSATCRNSLHCVALGLFV